MGRQAGAGYAGYDLTGQRFGRLVALRITKRKGKRVWLCQCDCGRLATSQTNQLREGRVSCGCLRWRGVVKHGEARNGAQSPEYQIWHGMRQRCRDEHCPGYPNYGGRGITICERWADFANFLADMGRRPSPKHSIDRIDNDGPYSPDNCRWATWAEQIRNRRSTRLLTAFGRTQCAKDWAVELGLHPSSFDFHLKRGETIESLAAKKKIA